MRVLIAGAVLAVSLASTVATSTTAHAVQNREISWLSTGDSFSSGEGITGAGISTDYCAQSDLAYGPRALKLLQEQRGYAVQKSAFSACTGHLTGDFYNEHSGEASQGKGSLWDWTEEQAGEGSTFDVATFSFGGNDIEFADLIKGCLDLPTSWKNITAPNGCGHSQAQLEQRIDNLSAGYPPNLAAHGYGHGGERISMSQFYSMVAEEHLNPGGLLIVVGYPRLFARSEDWQAWRGEFCQGITKADADVLGEASEYLDQSLRSAAEEANGAVSGGRVVKYVSRLELFDEGDGHSLCSSMGSEWLNGLGVGLSAGIRPEHSFHPNERGHQRTAEVVANLVDSVIAGGQEPPSAGPPPIQDFAPRFEAGSPFDARCVNAWPTAPTYTTQAITLTMNCSPDVPRQFLFVQVTYPDPNLPITPSTGQVRVEGVIVDTARSAYGYTTLVVQASSINFS